ncbi:hypothetical protein HPB50_022783 [Hyalomma asiaticum]|uniref:Uncharacterized protein n=1 Tax=Hyalomma asiaticum TaxID=266040 RepID=A0ACB7TLX9_HYAAI|nr:hypothetical protein HPB50_022783 [Hyalomma asiaticum]
MPSSVLWNRLLLDTLSWRQIDDLMLTRREWWLLRGECSLDEIEYRMRRVREAQLLRYRSRNGLLDVEQIELTLFRQQFRFDKEDINLLVDALLLPEQTTSAQKVAMPCRDALCLVLRRLAYQIDGILRDSGMYAKLERLVDGQGVVIYVDPAYPLLPLIMKPYGGFSLTPVQQAFNRAMSSVLQAVEWGFGKVVSEFAFLDLKKKTRSF